MPSCLSQIELIPLPEFSLVPEGADEAGAFTADSAQGMSGPSGELPEIAGAQVG
jgi:hypothetical protein